MSVKVQLKSHLFDKYSHLEPNSQKDNLIQKNKMYEMKICNQNTFNTNNQKKLTLKVITCIRLIVTYFNDI